MADLARAGLAFTMCLAAAIFLPLDVLGLRQYFTLFDQEFLEQQRNLPISLPLFLMVWLFTGFAFLLPIAAMVYYLLHALDSFRSSSVIYIVRRTKQAQARPGNQYQYFPVTGDVGPPQLSNVLELQEEVGINEENGGHICRSNSVAGWASCVVYPPLGCRSPRRMNRLR
jgi:hypothetical protein